MFNIRTKHGLGFAEILVTRFNLERKNALNYNV